MKGVAVQWRSGRAGARRLQGCGPPQQVIEQRPGGRIELGQSSVDITALEVSPKGGDGDVDRRANRGELKLDRRLSELLDGARAQAGAIAHEGGRLAKSLGIGPFDCAVELRLGCV